jgi:glycosyltransferase involved in cell wall biosynthesis
LDRERLHADGSTEAELKISVVVPAFNEEKLIAASLAAIRNAMSGFSDKGWETELIVCDNNSTDRTAELARAAGAIVVFEPVNQIARARNCGAAAASGEWLVFVDADSYPSPELFAEVAAAIISGTCLFGGVTVKMQGRHPSARIGTALWNCISRIGKLAAGSFIFCETAAFRRIGGFDNRFFASEEIDLSQRLKSIARSSGKRAIILHRHPILTSDRKVRLYSSRELLRLLMRSILAPRRTLQSRDACHAWYDGRR